jgi:CBS domain-containing protein
MFNQALISVPAPPLHPSDTVGKALELMQDLKVNQWPVVADNIFKGLITEEILLDANENEALSNFSFDFLPFFVPAEEHFLSAVRLMTERRLNVLPVTLDENAYAGVILQADLLQQLAAFSGSNVPGGMMVLEMTPLDFSLGEITRLIETNNAEIRQINTQIDAQTGLYRVSIRINRQEISDIIATFQRYDYSIVYFAGEEQFENELQRNYNHLLHYLEM